MSLAKVAREAGVAVSTVSRYVKGELNVASETARRIDAALSAQGHPPVQKQVTGLSLGLVVPSLDNPYFSTLADAVVDAAAADGIDVLTTLTGSSPLRERAAVERLMRVPDVGGLVYLGMHNTNEAFASRLAGDFPVVFLDEYVEATGPRIAHVTANGFGGAYQATTHLISLGHRRIAHVGGPAGLRTADQREAGYRAAMKTHGVEVDESMIVRGAFSSAFGMNFFAHMARAGAAPTAVFTASDIAAVGLLEAARRAGVTVPGDLSVIGCDGITLGEWTSPRLTTVAQPTEQMARKAVDEITRLAAGRVPADHVLSMRLVVRESTQEHPE
ncbi:LacI family DNA-binding transcriptional regulator [Amycolatopsis roodepoortensis]|uniref:LacI family transcriptional regulator/LacI family repressor for deo operon, udp, cdd, tsx, nupC, and nupG n=1 Tax=Amycolatopsis roodepoortensis TaxID=700274 RepID=A0ABR9LCI5_9PSEU|nr:LacI family DNA-binding transcriptional regulator [Amycolatopsis roodepoortensis]MBE1577826.1 LacI family transcriptional regulator/LacI family repressor for deo operon, udp, cdd, tsx, nupC, and nupG [Amycolatopsis roodepoortensis]